MALNNTYYYEHDNHDENKRRAADDLHNDTEPLVGYILHESWCQGEFFCEIAMDVINDEVEDHEYLIDKMKERTVSRLDSDASTEWNLFNVGWDALGGSLLQDIYGVKYGKSHSRIEMLWRLPTKDKLIMLVLLTIMIFVASPIIWVIVTFYCFVFKKMWDVVIYPMFGNGPTHQSDEEKEEEESFEPTIIKNNEGYPVGATIHRHR